MVSLIWRLVIILSIPLLNFIPLFISMFVLSSCSYKNSCCPFVAGGFQYTNPFCLGEDEELEIDLQEDFFSFEVDVVAEQLTYMDAVRIFFFMYKI